jgi:hypothetical protein
MIEKVRHANKHRWPQQRAISYALKAQAPLPAEFPFTRPGPSALCMSGRRICELESSSRVDPAALCMFSASKILTI